MKNEIYYSEKLKLRYKIKTDVLKHRVIVFEDNINYHENEFKKLNGLSENGLQKIHQIKTVFEGVIV